MVKFFKFKLGFIILELTFVSSLHYHHQRPAPPPRQPPRPPPPPPPPPPNTPGTTTPKPTTTTPRPEVEIELEETTTALRTSTVAPATTKQPAPAAQYYQGQNPYYNYYNQYYQGYQYNNSGNPYYDYSQYYQNYNRQPYDQNQYYNQAQSYNNGHYQGQSYVAGQGQTPPPYYHVTNTPYPTPYSNHQNYPAASQPPPPAYDQYNYAQNYQHGTPPKTNGHYQYDSFGATASPQTYYPPNHGSNYQPPPSPPHQQPPSPPHQQPPPQLHQQPPLPLNQQPPSPPHQQPPPQPHQQPPPQLNQQPPSPPHQQPPSPPRRQPPSPPHKTPAQSPYYPQEKVDTRHSPQLYPQSNNHISDQVRRNNHVDRGQSKPNRSPIPNQFASGRSSTVRRQKTQPVNRRPLIDTQYQRRVTGRGSSQTDYQLDANLPAPPTPLSESRYQAPDGSRRITDQSSNTRYHEQTRDILPPVTENVYDLQRSGPYQEQPRETVYDQQVNVPSRNKHSEFRTSASENVFINTLENRRPETPTAERYYQPSDRRRQNVEVSDSRYRSTSDVRGSEILKGETRYQIPDTGISPDTRKTERNYLRQTDVMISKTPPKEMSYVKALDKKSSAVKAEYNYLDGTEQRSRMPLENQLLDLKREELIILLNKARQKERKSKRENPYLKALFERPTPDLSKVRKKKDPNSNQQCPLYKFTVKKKTIEIHTNPGRCKIVIRLPADNKGKPSVSYLARNG